MSNGNCSIEGCDNPSRARGWCLVHYSRWRRFGTTEKKYPTDEARFWSKVQKLDPCWWWTDSLVYGYGNFCVDGDRTPAHRYAYELENGPIPDGLQIDHACHNPTCVRPSHLRLATMKQNAENRGGAQVNSKTGVRGVHIDARTNKYIGIVTHFGKRHYLGKFDSLFEAEAAVTAKRLELFTHNAGDRRAA